MNFFEPLKKYKFFNLPFIFIAFAFSLLAMLCVIVIPMEKSWSSRQDYSFGYIVPMFVAYILFIRFDDIYKYFSTPSAPAVKYSFLQKLISLVFYSMFFCGILTYLLGVFGYSTGGGFGAPIFIATFGFAFLFFAMAYISGERGIDGNLKPFGERIRYAGLFMFPAFIWLLAAPIFESVESQISLFLLDKVAKVVYEVMYFLGYVVTLRGNALDFPNGSVGVADACSGIRSLTACLFAGSFLASVFLNRLWKKVLMVSLSMFLAFLNNLIRALFLSFWAYNNGPESIGGEVHDYAGYFVMGMTIVELLLLMPLFQFSIVPKEFREDENNAASKEIGGQK